MKPIQSHAGGPACCHRSPQAYVAVPSTVKWGRSRYSFGLEFSFPIHVSAWLTTRSSILQEPVLCSLPQARRSESLPRIVALKSSGPSTQFAPPPLDCQNSQASEVGPVWLSLVLSKVPGTSRAVFILRMFTKHQAPRVADKIKQGLRLRKLFP